MTARFAQIKNWLPPLAGIAAVLIASSYAVLKQSGAAERIQEMNTLGNTLTQSAARARDSMLSPDQMEKIEATRQDVEARRRDALQPALVLAELTETARAVGLVLRDLQPVGPSQRRSDDKAGPQYPQYRVSVSGTYRQIGEYLQRCPRQRLPVRVTSFRVQASEAGSLEPEGLTAEITVESLVLRGESRKSKGESRNVKSGNRQ